MDEGGTNIFWAERYGRELGVEDLWVKMCGNSHTGSFKDLGMTVLVSVVKQMIADGVRHRRGRLRVDRRHVGGARRLRRGRRHPGRSSSCRARKVSAAQLVQPLANGALVLALDTDFDGCMAIVQRLADGRGRLPRQLDEQPAARGAEDAVDRDRAAVRLGSARRRRHPGRQPRQRQRARRRVPDDAGPRPDRQAPAARASRRPPRPTRSIAPTRTTGQFEPMRAQPTLATAIQIGNPVSIHRAIAALQAFDGIVEQATENELADAAGARRSHRHVQLPAHRRGAGGAREADRARARCGRPIG